MSETVPPLRHEITLEASDTPERPSALFDSGNRRRIKLDVTSAAIVALLDREQTLDELCQRADAHEVGASRQTIESILAFLQRYRLLEPPLLILDGDRFDCAMCGSSCGGHNIGPVDDELLDWLRPRQEELLQLTGSKRGQFVTVALGSEEREIVTTRMSHGSCVFLDERNLCALHGRYGAEHKPHTCHVFPFHFVETPDGIVVSYQMECRQYVASKRKASEPLSEQAQRLREMIRGLPSLPRIPEQAQRRPGVPLDYPAYAALEAEALGTIESSASLREAFCRIAALIDGGDAESRLVANDPQSFRRELAELQGLVSEGLREVRRRFADGTEGRTPRLDYLERTVAQLGQTLSRAMRPEESPESHELWRDTYRHFFHSKEALQIGDVETAHALFVFKYVIAHGLAFLRAQEVARAFVDPRDMADAVVVSNYLFRSPAILSMLLSERERIVALFGRRLASALFGYHELKEVSAETEFWLF